MANVRLPNDNNKNPIQVLAPIGLHEQLAAGATGTTATSNTFDSGEVVRLFTSDTGVYVSFVETASDDGTTKSFPLGSSSPEYFAIQGNGTKINVYGGTVDINQCL